MPAAWADEAHPPILIAGGGEKRTLPLVARFGDACNIPPSPELPAKLDLLKRLCEREGRDDDAIEKTVPFGFDVGERGEKAGETPGLPSLVLRLNPAEALPIASHDEAYFSVNGRLMPHQGDTAEAIAAANRFNELYGIESSYIAHTTFAWQEGVLHRPTWLVALYRVENVDAAADLVSQHARYDRSVGYDELVELDELPELDDPVAGSAYTEAWEDGSLNEGYRITVAVGSTVAIVDISAPGGLDQEAAFALVEAQVACLELGMCAPLQAPFTPVSAPATPAA